MSRKHDFSLEEYKKVWERVKDLLRKRVYQCAPRTSVSHLNKTHDVSHVFACCLQVATDGSGVVNEDLFMDLLSRRSEFEKE